MGIPMETGGAVGTGVAAGAGTGTAAGGPGPGTTEDDRARVAQASWEAGDFEGGAPATAGGARAGVRAMGAGAAAGKRASEGANVLLVVGGVAVGCLAPGAVTGTRDGGGGGGGGGG